MKSAGVVVGQTSWFVPYFRRRASAAMRASGVDSARWENIASLVLLNMGPTGRLYRFSKVISGWDRYEGARKSMASGFVDIAATGFQHSRAPTKRSAAVSKTSRSKINRREGVKVC